MEGGPPSSCLQRGAPCHGIIGIMVNPPLLSAVVLRPTLARTPTRAAVRPTATNALCSVVRGAASLYMQPTAAQPSAAWSVA